VLGNEVDGLHYLYPKPKEYCLALPSGFFLGFFQICSVARGCQNPKSKGDINGDSFMIWPLKLLSTGGPVVTFSPRNFKTVSVWRFVSQKTGHFRQILEAVSPFSEFSRQKKNHCLPFLCLKS
jgi:hypothetical protein